MHGGGNERTRNMEIKISEELNSIINYAREEAMRTGSYGIDPDHLYLGILRHHDNAACGTLEKLGTATDSMNLLQGVTEHSQPFDNGSRQASVRGSRATASSAGIVQIHRKLRHYLSEKHRH